MNKIPNKPSAGKTGREEAKKVMAEIQSLVPSIVKQKPNSKVKIYPNNYSHKQEGVNLEIDNHTLVCQSAPDTDVEHFLSLAIYDLRFDPKLNMALDEKGTPMNSFSNDRMKKHEQYGWIYDKNDKLTWTDLNNKKNSYTSDEIVKNWVTELVKSI